MKPGFAWIRRLLPMSRRDQARLAQLDHTRAGMATIADVLRDLSAQHDAHVHAIQQAMRFSCGALIGAEAVDQVTDVVVRSRRTAEVLDGAVEALERIAAALRD